MQMKYAFRSFARSNADSVSAVVPDWVTKMSRVSLMSSLSWKPLTSVAMSA